MLQNGYWRSVALQFVSEPEICQGTELLLRAGARVQMQVSAGFLLGAGVKAKTMTNNLPILSVLGCVVCPELLQGTRSLKVL
jgi:hypothetical protein